MTDANTSVLTGTELATQESQTLGGAQSEQGLPLETTEQPPQYVTKDDLLQLEENLLRRVKQSSKDRTKHIEDEVANIKSRLEGTGVQLQPNQEQALRNRISDLLEEEDSVQQPEVTEDAPAFEINTFVSEYLEPYGVKVNPQSPHYAELDKVIQESWNDPKGHTRVLKAINEYGQKESQRLANNQNNATARVIGGGGGSSSSNPDAPAIDLWKQAYKK